MATLGRRASEPATAPAVSGGAGRWWERAALGSPVRGGRGGLGCSKDLVICNVIVLLFAEDSAAPTEEQRDSCVSGGVKTELT